MSSVAVRQASGPRDMSQTRTKNGLCSDWFRRGGWGRHASVASPTHWNRSVLVNGPPTVRVCEEPRPYHCIGVQAVEWRVPPPAQRVIRQDPRLSRCRSLRQFLPRRRLEFGAIVQFPFETANERAPLSDTTGRDTQRRHPGHRTGSVEYVPSSVNPGTLRFTLPHGLPQPTLSDPATQLSESRD